MQLVGRLYSDIIEEAKLQNESERFEVRLEHISTDCLLTTQILL